jgi:hypothetical protein
MNIMRSLRIDDEIMKDDLIQHLVFYSLGWEVRIIA